LGKTNSLGVHDIGCGIGGTVRNLASSFDCRVTGIDLIPTTYISLAEKPSHMVGLSKETSFYKETSALDLPFSNEEYEVVWMEHVQMNIPSKGKFATELARVLR